MKVNLFTLALYSAAVVLLSQSAALAGKWENVSEMLGINDSASVWSSENEVLFEKNPDKKLIPASTLKFVTALTAFYYFGPDFRFKTGFYVDSKNNLVIKGYGDPLLISEEVEKISQTLAGRIKSINAIVLDDSYFDPGIDIPGTADGSFQPYDAPIGALCVNFNTVSVKKTKNGYESAEPQTPLLPSALKKIRRKNPDEERILLSSGNSENLIYAGELFAWFLSAEGLKIKGDIRTGRAETEKYRLVYLHRSNFALTEVVSMLMEYSNNFIANQLLAASGAKAYGPPATLKKGLLAAQSYASKELGIFPQMVEGSGISRKNRMSAKMFMPVLKKFGPFYRLLPENKGIFFKTGTLEGISTRAGYIQTGGKLSKFAVLINTPGRKAEPVVQEIASALKEAD